MKPAALRTRYDEFRGNWITLSVYERFEQVVAIAIAWLVAVTIVVAVWSLCRQVFLLLLHGLLDPLDHKVFQAVFGQIATVLIALEFKHSIVKVVAAREHVIQVRTVLLVALLALARKLIILDPHEFPAGTIFSLAALIVAVGVTYWLVRDRDTWRSVARGHEEQVDGSGR
jgi:uncharacterized membrane protein (DUF373 family)